MKEVAFGLRELLLLSCSEQLQNHIDTFDLPGSNLSLNFQTSSSERILMTYSTMLLKTHRLIDEYRAAHLS